MVDSRKKPISPWIFILLGAFVSTFLGSPAQAADIKVRADRNPVAVNESFQLFFETADDIDGDPDFSPLKQNFDILERKQSTNFQFINGARSRSATWILTLMAKQTGKIAIPAIRFGSSSTAPTAINVIESRVPTAAADPTGSPDMFLQVESDSDNPYIQSQAVLTIKFFRAVAISQANMTSPTFSGGEVIVEPLGKGRHYETQLNGKSYIVEERRYAIFPQVSGKIIMKPIQLTARVGSGNRIFDGFFNDPFGRGRISTRRINSKALELQVRPIPDAFTGKRWLAAHELILTGKWSDDPAKMVVGEPITRITTMMADGIPGKQLPETPIIEAPGLKQYTDRPEVGDQTQVTGIVGKLRQKTAIIPTAPGTYEMAAIEVPWWDVDEDKMKVARLPAVTFSAAPGANAGREPTIAPPMATPQTEPTPDSVLPATNAGVAALPAPPVASPGLTWLNLFLGVGWLLTAAAWWWSHKRAHEDNLAATGDDPEKSRAKILQQLQAQLLANSPGKARPLLLLWAAGEWPDMAEPGIDAIKSRVEPGFREELDRMDRALYAQTDSDWRGERLWQKLEAHVKKSGNSKNNQEAGKLLPLYET